MTPEEQIDAGRKAELALAVIDPAFAKVRASLIEALIATSDPVKVAKLHSGAQIIDAVRNAISETIQGGQMSLAILEAEDPS